MINNDFCNTCISNFFSEIFYKTHFIQLYIVPVGGLPVISLPRSKFFMSKSIFIHYTHTPGTLCSRLAICLKGQLGRWKIKLTNCTVSPPFIPKFKTHRWMQSRFSQCQGNGMLLENALTLSDFSNGQEGRAQKKRITQRTKHAGIIKLPQHELNNTYSIHPNIS